MKENQFITVDHPNGIARSSQAQLPFAYFTNPQHTAENKKAITNVRVNDLIMPHFSMRISEGQFDQEAVFVNTSAEGLDLIGSCLLLKGDIKSSVDRTSDGIVSFNGSQNFKYDPHNIFVHTLPAHHPFHIIHFSYKPDYIYQFLPEGEWWTDGFKKKIDNRESFIGDRYTPITLLQERALQNILNCPLDGHLGQVMMETSFVQIMLIQLHSIFQDKSTFQVKATRRDMDVIQGVKEYLTSSFLQDHSLESIAKQFGVNTNKLMTLFKMIFNKSIFEYLYELKMDYARTLLEEQDRLVVEVAREVGYKNPNHFSAAFKKRFGISPSQLR